MADEKLEELTKRAFNGLGIAMCIVALTYLVIFIIGHLGIQSQVGNFLIMGITPIVALFSFLAKRHPIFRKSVCILLVIAIALINTLNTVKIGLLFISPALLSLYLSDKKFIYRLLVLDFIALCISIYFRALGFAEFINMVKVSDDILEHVAASIFCLSIETICTLLLLIPYYRYMLDLKVTKTTFLEEKASATEEVLKFCSKTMSYHNKYLTVHNSGVESITTIILKDLHKRHIYDEYLTPAKMKEIIFSVQFHDIGKIYIDPIILDKRGKLTPEEYEFIKHHPTKGYELMQELPKNAMEPSLRETCKNVILEHHERLNGKGYPYGKTVITIEGQIIAVADVVDALLSWRPYKKPFSWEALVEIITTDTGLNTECVQSILNCKEEVLQVASRDNEKLAIMFNL